MWLPMSVMEYSPAMNGRSTSRRPWVRCYDGRNVVVRCDLQEVRLELCVGDDVDRLEGLVEAGLLEKN